MLLDHVKKYFAFIWSLLVLFAGLFTRTVAPVDAPNLEVVSNYHYIMDEALVMGQGLANDGTYLYSSGAISALYLGALSKIDMNTGEILLRKINAIPKEFVKKGYDHIGDISWHNGLIYAPVEDLQEEQPLVLLYDAETLEYTGTYFELDNTYLPDGIPWCTVDADNGYLYASPFKNVTCIVAFNLSDMSFSHIIPLSEEITRVQAADYFDGKLYVNLDTQGTGYKEIKVIDVNTGEVSLLAQRDMQGRDVETEGLTITRDENGKLLFHITDYDKTVSVYLRTYRLTD